MRRQILVLRICLIFLFSFAAMATGLPDQKVPPPETPQRIVSLAPFITEELYILGIEDRLVACTTFCNRPDEARKKLRVSTAVKPNIEKIYALKPDLVLSSELIDPKSISHLKKLGLTVETFPVAKNFKEICDIFFKISTLVGKEEAAQLIIQKSMNRIQTLKDSVKRDPKGSMKIFMQIGMKPLFTVIKDTFLNDYISIAGGNNIAGDLSSGMISRETVLQRNPDVIFIVSMGNYHEGEKKLWMAHHGMSAVKNKHIYVLDAKKICSPTPVTFCDSLEKIVNILNTVSPQ